MEDIEKRAAAIKKTGSIKAAVLSGETARYQDLPASEAIVLGLLNQGVRKYVGVFGHGTTEIGNVLRVYQKAGIVSVFNVRHETEASHIASALKWQYGETAAVFTSIGPGALQAFAGSLVGVSNGLGIYYLFGDETTHDEGFNMQQIARHEQSLFLKLTSHMGPSYMLHTPEAVTAAMKRGIASVFHPFRQSPFFLLAPMNVQACIIPVFNLLELPEVATISTHGCEKSMIDRAAEIIRGYERITIKTGRGALGVPRDVMELFVELTGAVYTHSPAAPGILPAYHELNMGVGGSKGSICGNYAMENANLVIVIGARAVCQWDSSGTAWKKTKEFININTMAEDAFHYNNTLPLIGDAETIIRQLNERLGGKPGGKTDTPPKPGKDKAQWHEECKEARAEWEAFKQERFAHPVLHDRKWGREMLTQPAAIKTVVDFAVSRDCAKLFDAGDVQANGFQLVEDETVGRTYTETGASYMGFAVSALAAGGIADNGRYSIAFTGDGSFTMNPQVLIDAVEHRAKGMIVLFDNRRMAAISSLQQAQYGVDFKTDDTVEVDYVKMAEAVKGVRGFFGGYSAAELSKALNEAAAYDGLSLVHVPVYAGEEERGGLGAFGSWNVGNWCEKVQQEKHRLGL